jgi:hypothetical protein
MELKERFDRVGLILKKNQDYFELTSKKEPAKTLYIYHYKSTVIAELKYRETMAESRAKCPLIQQATSKQ